MRKQHRQTVGHHDRAGKASLARQAGICNQTIDAVVTQFQHLGAMHLLQKDRLTSDSALQDMSIGRDCVSIISNVIAQVQRVIRRQRNTALTRGEDGPNTCGRRPLRGQPVGFIHCPGKPKALPF
jgi:hypothetical protein